MSSFSASRKLPSIELPHRNPFRRFFGFTDECESPCLNDLLISPSARTTDNGREENDKIVEAMTKCDSGVSGRFEGLSTLNESTQLITAVRTSTNECDSKDDNDNILSPESILVLLFSQCIEKGLVCEQSHLSMIKEFYAFSEDVLPFRTGIYLPLSRCRNGMLKVEKSKSFFAKSMDEKVYHQANKKEYKKEVQVHVKTFNGFLIPGVLRTSVRMAANYAQVGAYVRPRHMA
ncbi:hypothetical protein HPP92_005683 [Vanilla planifolia]|uniref:Uncharacterized protein n=1 Tax=Vanilla planifolia TaxID=51239 RepID=A0A835RQ04_VANPL|nr:hypothetical protein HPP92_005683 [Vanilla planifolia]